MAQPAQLARIGVRLEAVPSPGWALLSLILLNLMWGGSLPATKVALDSFGPFTLAAARLLLASVLFVIVVMLSSVAAALYTVLGKGLARRNSPLMFCGVSCLGGALASVPLAFWELSSSTLRPTILGWALLAYLAILVTFVGFIIWFWGLRALPAAQAGALMFLQPLSGLILAVLILGDRPTPGFLIGCGLVLAGVYLAAGGGRRRR